MDEYKAITALLDLYRPIYIPDISEFFNYLLYSKSPNLTIDYDHNILVDQKTLYESQNATLKETASQEEPPDLTLKIITNTSIIPISKFLK